MIEALHLLGEVALNEGDFDRSIAMTEESIAMTRAQGDRRYLIHSLDNLARALLCRGELSRALDLWTEGLRLSCEWRDTRGIAYYLEGFAGASAAQEVPERAARLWGAAQTLRQQMGSPLSPSEASILDTFLASARTQLGEARWADASDEGGDKTLEQIVAYALEEASAP